jgi:CRP/FNR family transcriptional regulator, cyclic AMP receptor protein
MSAAQSGKIKFARPLGSQPIFASLQAAAIREIESLVVVASHSTRSVIYRQGEIPEGIFFLLRGRVKMSAIAIDAKTALLKIARPGEVLGLTAVLSGKRHVTTAQTTQPSSLGLLRREDLAHTMQKYPQLAEAIAQHVAAECSDIAVETLLLRVPTSSSQKLAVALLRMAEADTAARQPGLTYTHAELGQLIGASRETVTRLMRRFEREGLIAAKKSTFRITAPIRLKQIAGISLTSRTGKRFLQTGVVQFS